MLRLGVVGYGLRARSVIQDSLRIVEPSLNVVGIVDPNETRAREFVGEAASPDLAFYPSLKTMAKKARLDGLLIATRCNLHTPIAIEAAALGIPVYLEKPVSIDMKQATQLEKAYLKSRTPVMVGFPLRVSPLCLRTRELIEQGEIGDPQHILATNYVTYGTVYWEEGYRNYDLTRGLLLQKATHDLDAMMYLMGSYVTRVSAMATFGRVFGGNKPKGLHCAVCKEAETCLESPANRKRNFSGGILTDHPCVFSKDCGSPESGTNEDSSSVLLEFSTGAQGVYTQVFFSRRSAARRGAIISGYQGTLDFDWNRKDLKVMRHHNPFDDLVASPSGLAHFGGDSELARDFIAMMKGKTACRTPLAAGLQSVYTCLGAMESIKKGVTVKVRQTEL